MPRRVESVNESVRQKFCGNFASTLAEIHINRTSDTKTARDLENHIWLEPSTGIDLYTSKVVEETEYYIPPGGVWSERDLN